MRHVFAILGIGIPCFLVFVWLMPDIEASRSEARIVQAYNDVRQMSAAHRETASPDLFSVHEIPDTDPWGQPYRLVAINEKQVRALSCGPNMHTAEVGVDHDDIYSDMPASPMALIFSAKKRQLMIAVGISAGLWLLLSIVYLRSR